MPDDVPAVAPGASHDRYVATLERLLAVRAATVREALDRASDIIAEILSADKIDAFLYEPAGDLLVALGVSDTPMGRREREVGLDRLPLVGGGRHVEVFRTGRSYHTGHLERDPWEVPGFARDLGVRSAVSVPLEVAGERRGVLGAMAAAPEAFGAEDVRFVGAVAGWLGLVVGRVEAEEGRRVAEAEGMFLREIFRQAPAMIGVTEGPDHIFTFVNPVYEHGVGRRAPDLIGVSVRAAFPELAGQGIYEILDEVYRTGEPFVGAETLIRLDRTGEGRLEDVFFTFVYQPLRDARGVVGGIMAHAVDVTEQVRARRRVEELAAQVERERAFLAGVLEQLPIGVSLVEAPSGRPLLHNAAAIHLLGHPLLAPEAADHTAYARYGARHPDGTRYAPEEYPSVRAARGEEVPPEEMLYRRGDGGMTTFAVGAAPIHDADGRTVAAVSTFEDISARKRAEAEREEALARAEAAVRLRDDFLRMAAHDLRSPLTSLRGRAQLVQGRLKRDDAVAPDWLRGQMDAVCAATTRMLGIIDELGDVARLHEGRDLELEREGVDVGALARAVAEEVGVGRPAPVRVEAPATPVVVEGDRARLERVLHNIVGNAVKYSPPEAPVRVTVAEAGASAEVMVRDEGVGIPAEDLPHLFTRYYRASTARGTPGSGLGLAGSRAIVEQHGGAIVVESAIGQGTIVTITLPRAPREATGDA